MHCGSIPGALGHVCRRPVLGCFTTARPQVRRRSAFRSAGAAQVAVPQRLLQEQFQRCSLRPSRRSSPQVLRAQPEHKADAEEPQQDWTRLATSAGLFLLWAGVLGYVFALSPNQTPFRDQLFLEKLVGINPNSTVDVGRIFFNLFNIMGVYPALYAALLLPAGRSSNKVPAWPFVALSFGAGVFALLPYFALWSPQPRSQQPLLPKSELGFFQRALESRVTAGVLLAASIFLVGSAATAGGQEWASYFKLFDESRFVHVTSLDFLLLSTFIPFWLVNDAECRDFQYKDQAILFALLPVIGPALYLLLRPTSPE